MIERLARMKAVSARIENVCLGDEEVSEHVEQAIMRFCSATMATILTRKNTGKRKPTEEEYLETQDLFVELAEKFCDYVEARTK